MKSSVFILSILTVLLTSQNLSAKIYKWVDENGVMQFSTQPPADQQNKKFDSVDIHSGRVKSKIFGSFLSDNWYFYDGIIKYELKLSDNEYSLRQIDGHVSKFNRGKMTRDKKRISVIYETHIDKKMFGMKEVFFIKKSDDMNLVLVSQKNNKRYEFTKKAETKPYSHSSSSFEKFGGRWKGTGNDDSIHFSNSSFTIRGRIKYWSGDNYYYSVSDKYEGYWRFDDPYLILEFYTDRVAEKEDVASIEGETLKYQILESSDSRLVLLTPERQKWILLRQSY